MRLKDFLAIALTLPKEVQESEILLEFSVEENDALVFTGINNLAVVDHNRYIGKSENESGLIDQIGYMALPASERKCFELYLKKNQLVICGGDLLQSMPVPESAINPEPATVPHLRLEQE